MKAKTIRSVLRRKLEHFAANIPDEAVRAVVKRDAIITGGSITSMLMGEPVNDYDIYFKSLQAVRLVAGHYVERFKQEPPPRSQSHQFEISVKESPDARLPEGVRVKIVAQSAGIASENPAPDYEYFEGSGDPEAAGRYVDAATAEAADKEDKSKPKYRPVFLSANAISLSHEVQLVTRFYGSADEIHKNYDFVHCTCSWDAETGQLRLPPAALESMLAKDLRYIASLYPLCAIIRTRKFLHRGWRITAGQYLKMAWDLNKLNLADPDVLEDQLTGVDAAYFEEVIQLLRMQMKKTGAKEIDGAYLMEVVDKIF